MNLLGHVGSSAYGRVRTELRDAATGKIVSQSGWTKNLVYDTALNALAAPGTGFANLFTFLKIGSGSSANFVASPGGVTFTQVGTTITCNTVGWFTANLPMYQSWANSLFRYNNASVGAGQEFYISSIDGTGTIATVTAGATVATASAASIYFVNQTAMQTLLLTSNSYQTSAGSCFSTVSADQLTMQRTFTFPVQASPYNVNEIGYYNASAGSTVFGRITLSSTDVVPPSQFYVVILQMIITVSPGTITSVANVGTNFNTAGTVCWQNWSCVVVQADGSSGNIGTNGSYMDSLSTSNLYLHVANDLTQNSVPSVSNAVNVTTNNLPVINIATNTHAGQPVGVGVVNASPFSISTSGETCYSMLFKSAGSTGQTFYLFLTTPQVLPVGTFQGNISFKFVFSRTLTN